MNLGQELQEIEEVDCVNRFLPFYTTNKNSSVEKNPKQDEVDIFVRFQDGNLLKIQVTVADSTRTGAFRGQISRKQKGKFSDIPFSMRDRHDIKPVLKALGKKLALYEKQGKLVNDVILLIDDQLGDFPMSTVNTIDWGAHVSMFKEVWYVGRTNCVYKILQVN